MTSPRSLFRPKAIGYRLFCLSFVLSFSPLEAGANSATCNSADPAGNASIVCLGDPCEVTKNWDFTGDCELDFGLRSLVIRGESLTARGANLTIRAGSVTALKIGSATPLLSVRSGSSTRGGNLGIVSFSFIDINGKVDASGTPAGNIVMTAVGNITLSGNVEAVGTTGDGGGGNITIRAGQDLSQNARVEADGGGNDAGGNIALLAARNLDCPGMVSARGGEFSGGWVSLTAGDDLTVSGDLDASSGTGGGDGGMVDIIGGRDLVGGAKPGGGVTLLSSIVNLTPSSTGTGFDAWAGDGGELFVQADGDVYIGPAVRIKSWGAAPDGSGGDVFMVNADAVVHGIGPLDGNMDVLGDILNTGQGGGSDGGSVTLSAGRDLTLGSVDVSSGWQAGDFSADAGGNVHLTKMVDARGGGSDGDGGAIDITAGLGSLGTVTVDSGANLLAQGGSLSGPSLGGDITVIGCILDVASATTVDTRGGFGLDSRPFGGDILLAAPMGGTLRASFKATPGGEILAMHRGAFALATAAATFDPPLTVEVVESSPLYPGCGENPTPTPIPASICGNGIWEQGEGCDDGNTASGDCCSSACQPEPNGSSCPSGDPCLVGQCSGGSCVLSSVADCSSLGDVNCDGAMNTSDALTDLCLFVKLCQDSDLPAPCNSVAQRLAVADWDLNGQIDASDALTTLALFVDLISQGDTALGACCL